jgi:hypothetical protein
MPPRERRRSRRGSEGRRLATNPLKGRLESRAATKGAVRKGWEQSARTLTAAARNNRRGTRAPGEDPLQGRGAPGGGGTAERDDAGAGVSWVVGPSCVRAVRAHWTSAASAPGAAASFRRTMVASRGMLRAR